MKSKLEGIIERKALVLQSRKDEIYNTSAALRAARRCPGRILQTIKYNK